MIIAEETVLIPGLTAKPTRRGFVSVDLAPAADPIALTPEVMDAEKQRLGCIRQPDGTWRLSWRWRKEYERDFTAQQGKPVFDSEGLVLQEPRLWNPLYRMDLDESGKKLVRKDRGRLLVFIEPSAPPPQPLPTGIETVTRSCGIGMDVSEGVGASDSTIEVFFADTKEQAAELADNEIKPADLGRFAAAVARFYNYALVCCVRRMHGITTIRTMLDECRYGHLWHHHLADRPNEKRAASLGWAGDETSELLFGRWIDAIQHDETQLHSLACWQQHQQYIYDAAGRIVHQERANLPRDVRERHGDRVIGCALAYRACLDLPWVKASQKRVAPIGSLLHRRQEAERKKSKSEAW